MSPLIIIMAVLSAAILHAVWNATVKHHNDKLVMMLTIAIVQSSIALAMVPFLGLPEVAAWPWLISAAIPHTTYKIALAKAYETGDMTRIYPISRGLSIVIVTTASLLILDEDISGWGLMGIIIISIGVFGLSTKDYSSDSFNLTKTALLLCIVAGASVALYTIIDGIGVRVNQATPSFLNIATFASWLFILDGLGMIFFMLSYKGRKSFNAVINTGFLGLFAGSSAFVCFWIAIWAFAYAPIAMVAALRETSVLFSLLLGRLFLKEMVNRQRFIFACIVLSGIVMLRFS